MTTKRHKSRELALQLLYQIDMLKTDPANAIEGFFTNFKEHAKYKEYALKIVYGVCENLADIDSRIKELSKNWKLDRIEKVALAILRMAVFEIALMEEPIPKAVAIDESVLLAKRFCSADTYVFIHGILNNI